MIELSPQPVDLAMRPQLETDGAASPRLPLSEITGLQDAMNAPLQGEDSCEFLNDIEDEFSALNIVDGDEFWDRFCSPMF